MPSPDLIAPDRLEELLGGALPEAEREARLQGLVRELRAGAPAAPAPLRARVRALEEQPAPRRRAFPQRRTALALAFVLLAVAGVSAGIVWSDGSVPSEEVAVEAAAGDVTVPATTDVGATADQAEEAPAPAELSPQAGRRLLSPSAADLMQPRFGSPGRATDLSLSMAVRLPGADELSEAAVEAMAITRELGGWVAASDIDTKGNEGTAELALRVPVGRVEDAVVRLGALGTVTGQQVATVDLQAGIDRRDDRIERIERAIRTQELRLESGTLTPEQELEARLRIERLRNEAADLRRANLGDRRKAATSELALTLHTRAAVAAAQKDEGGVAGAAAAALRFLGAAGAIALFLAIVLSPVVLLAVLLWLALRARSRRVEARLLDAPGPAAPPPA
jgi:Domain of unknown function (DUF4349)